MEHQTAFYEAIADDARIRTTHICLYFALCHAIVGLVDGKLNEVNRDQLMRHARISRKTYNKCMKELQEYGYIKYEPSSNPQVGSKVQLKTL